MSGKVSTNTQQAVINLDPRTKLYTLGKTSLIITHDPELIAECCDYFIFIEDGTVKWYGPFDTQNGQRVQQFFGSEEGGAL